MDQSTLQSLIALVISNRRELVSIREIMIGEGEIHYELAEPMTPIGKLNFRKLNYTLNEIRRVEKRIERMDAILPQLKKELKRRVSIDNLDQLIDDDNNKRSGYSKSSYRVTKTSIFGDDLNFAKANTDKVKRFHNIY